MIRSILSIRFITERSDDEKDEVSGKGKTRYKTGCRLGEWWFCGRCGSVGGLDFGKQSGVVDEDGEPRSLVNVRMLKDFDESKLKIRKSEAMSSVGPSYTVGMEM
ncbi:unnamed protein product [Zymoseptoria tritici ST99CH_3D7]|uniref:CENP-V/GFA domain-containing protein n=1 Tax=Zymoseptoria tritici (strain ST99CH_3D7) TaxID=1276538 RepID=A0A1X7RID1_ZYMT9|nr:unnamed protein product [Zymoseptoria tritici ST99CH_3D7]